MGDYLDSTGRDDALTGGVRLIPIDTPKVLPGLDQARRQRPRLAAAPARRPGRHPRVLRGARQLPAGGRHRVLLLRPARLALQRPAGRARRCGSSRASSTRSSRCGRRSGSTGRLLPAGHSWGGMLAIEYALRNQQHLKGLIDLQHDGQHPGVQRVRPRRADADDGPGRARRDQAARGRRRHRNPRYMELLCEHHYVHHVLRMPADEWPDPVVARLRAHQPGHLRPDAGPERARASGKLARLGSHRRPGRIDVPDAGHRRRARHDGPRPHGMDGRALPQGPHHHSPTAAIWRSSTTPTPTSAAWWRSCTASE